MGIDEKKFTLLEPANDQLWSSGLPIGWAEADDMITTRREVGLLLTLSLNYPYHYQWLRLPTITCTKLDHIMTVKCESVIIFWNFIEN